MPDSMSEILRSEMECEGLLECFHGLNALDREVFQILVETECGLTVDELAGTVDRERSTAYRSVRRLAEAGFAVKEQRTYASGGYYHVFRAADPDDVADGLQRMLNDWYAKMGQLIGEFRETYDTPQSADTASEQVDGER